MKLPKGRLRANAEISAPFWSHMVMETLMRWQHISSSDQMQPNLVLQTEFSTWFLPAVKVSTAAYPYGSAFIYIKAGTVSWQAGHFQNCGANKWSAWQQDRCSLINKDGSLQHLCMISASDTRWPNTEASCQGQMFGSKCLPMQILISWARPGPTQQSPRFPPAHTGKSTSETIL